MLKNAKTKLSVTLIITGLIGILSIGITTIIMLENMLATAGSEADTIRMDIIKIEIILGIIALIYVILSICVGILISKKIMKPAEKLINVAEEVSTQKKQMETMLLHMTDGILAFNMDGKISLTNPAATRLLRIMPEDDTFDKIFGKYNIDVNLEKVIYLENWTSTAQKATIGDNYIYMFFAPLRNEDETPSGVIVVIQDITEHVKLDNMRKEFVADVSHELKTPITSIMGYADTLLEGEYDKETQEKFLNVIATEARRMAKLVTDLLTLSKYDNDEDRTKNRQKTSQCRMFCHSKCSVSICRQRWN